MEENLATYILNEKDWASKLEIMYYLEKRGLVFFDKSVVLKAELVKLFINIMGIKEVDENLTMTACLLCNCKKPATFTDMKKVKTFAKEGAEYLKKIGFSDRFCKICEEVNRYSNSENREKESDILELVDNFGGMILDRYDRIAYKPEEAVMLLEYRNLKNKENRYLDDFIDFVYLIQKVHIGLTSGIEYISKIINSSRTTKLAIVNAYNSEIDIERAYDKMIGKEIEEMNKEEHIEEIKIVIEEIEKLILRRD